LCMDGRWALIDFNPRLFNQIGLDIYRQMPLPLLACLDAFGDHRGLNEAVGRALAYDQSQPAIIQDGYTLRAVLLAQAFVSASGRAQRNDWNAYMKRHASHAVDFAADGRDRLPALIHAISETLLGLRAIPRFLRARARSSVSTRPKAAERAI
jgi:D-aspartate ligase